MVSSLGLTVKHGQRGGAPLRQLRKYGLRSPFVVVDNVIWYLVLGPREDVLDKLAPGFAWYNKTCI